MACASIVLFVANTTAQQPAAIPDQYQQVLTALNRQGDYSANVLKVNIPRSDVKVTIDQKAAPTPFGFGGWVAFTKGTGGMDVMMGDLVVTQDEVSPVMSALLDNGLDVTALHNHFLWDEPRVMYMHVHGHGRPADLARELKPAIDLIGKGGRGLAPAAAPAGPAPVPAFDTAKLAQIAAQQDKKGNGSIEELLHSGEVWSVREDGSIERRGMGSGE